MKDKNNINNNEEILHIGFDDTDSIKGRCTTHLSFLISSILLKKFQIEFIDFPLLIRLNPNVPFKTRGNGAVCLRVRGKSYHKIKEEILFIVENYSELQDGANPGLVFYEGNNIVEDLSILSKKAMNTVLSKQLGEKIARRNNIQYHTFGKGYGLVGALSAIGNPLNSDHTFEAIAYRKIENIGTTRTVDRTIVNKLNKELAPFTYNNFDHNNNRILITPHGPDPVFCGIRGEYPTTTLLFLKKLQIQEDLAGYMIFRSNQGTNLHLIKENSISDILPYTSGYIDCQVITKPYIINGGHVIFHVNDKYDTEIPVAVYKPTGLTKIASKLEVGDKVEIGYGAHIKTSNQKTLNLEYLFIKNLKTIFDSRNPVCTICFKSMKSEGKNKGFQCPKCKIKKKNSDKIRIEIDRKIKNGLYIPEPIAHRHLTKPLSRYGMEKQFNKMDLSYLLKNTRWIETNSGGLI